MCCNSCRHDELRVAQCSTMASIAMPVRTLAALHEALRLTVTILRIARARLRINWRNARSGLCKGCWISSRKYRERGIILPLLARPPPLPPGVELHISDMVRDLPNVSFMADRSPMKSPCKSDDLHVVFMSGTTSVVCCGSRPARLCLRVVSCPLRRQSQEIPRAR